MPPGLKVVNTDDVGVSGSGTTGVVGTGISGSDPTGGGGSAAGIGVAGTGWTGVSGQGDFFGVIGGGNSGPGVFGTSTGIGVSGLGGNTGVSGTGTAAGVLGSSPAAGIVGVSQGDTGVYGVGDKIGVEGDGKGSGIGVLGMVGGGPKDAGTGVVAANWNDDGWGLQVHGGCSITGDFFVGDDFNKYALIRLRNGEHRALYCMESPECWFEDFGRARLVRGAARVRLDRIFAEVVRTGDYHVFLSPEGLSHGLYVSRRTRNGFEVREQHQGKSTVPFSYRIVARRKDVEGPRFKRVTPPPPLKRPRRAKAKRPEAPMLPQIPKSVQPPQLQALLKRVQSANPAQRKLRRRGSR